MKTFKEYENLAFKLFDDAGEFATITKAELWSIKNMLNDLASQNEALTKRVEALEKKSKEADDKIISSSLGFPVLRF